MSGEYNSIANANLIYPGNQPRVSGEYSSRVRSPRRPRAESTPRERGIRRLCCSTLATEGESTPRERGILPWRPWGAAKWRESTPRERGIRPSASSCLPAILESTPRERGIPPPVVQVVVRR